MLYLANQDLIANFQLHQVQQPVIHDAPLFLIAASPLYWQDSFQLFYNVLYEFMLW